MVYSDPGYQECNDLGCEVGWIRFKDECLYFATADEATKYNRANYACRQQKASLVVIDSEEKQDFVRDQIAG